MREHDRRRQRAAVGEKRRPPSFVVVLVATCGFACDGGQPAKPSFAPIVNAPPPDFVSGLRLRARYHVVEGFQVFTTFHDAQLDLDCTYEDERGPHVGPAASSYCFPADLARHRKGRGPFADRLCTVPVALAPQSGVGRYVLVEPRDACATAPVTFDAMPPRTELTFLNDDTGACVRSSRVSVQRFGGRLPPESFVRAVEQTEPRAGRMDVRVLVGDDGSRRVVGGFDRERGEATRTGLTEDGTLRWVPVRSAFIGGGEPLFEDAHCAVPLASKIGRTATCPLSSVLVLEGTCGGGHYLALGDRVTNVFHRDVTDACAPASAPDVVAFRLGAAVPAASYAPVISFEIGTPRVRRRAAGVGGDRAITWAELIDGTTREACEVTTTADGSLRCLPAFAESVLFFADSACTVHAFAHATTGCEPATALSFVRDTLETPTRAFRIVSEVDAIYMLDAGRCRPFTPVVASRTYAVEELDTTRFPLATLSGD